MLTPRPFAGRLNKHLPLGLAVALTALLSLPQFWPFDRVVDHQDPLFSMWRIAWIGHALAESPGQLFHANIFYPDRYTLTYSDSVLLQGVAGSALRAIGLSPPVAYNLLMWLSYPLSAFTMFLLARKVSGSPWGAFVAALAYSLSAVRFDHIMHLENTWTQWVPLLLFCGIRAFEEGTVRWALALAASLLLQLTSGLYLFLFTGPVLMLLVAGIALAGRLAPLGRAVRAAVIVAAIVGPPAAAYARTYAVGLEQIGPRRLEDVGQYSASPSNFFSAPERNLIYGWTEEFWGAPERQLFAGFAVMGLAAVALVRITRPYRAVLAVLTVFTGLMCLGVNGWLYEFFYEWVPGFSNLRVPARFANHLSAAIAALAACGLHDLVGPATSQRRRLAVGALASLVLLEATTGPPEHTRTVPTAPSDLDRVLAANPEGAIVEYPLPRAASLPAWDAVYQMRSIHHWRPLVNGYSGHYAPSYVERLERLDRAVPGDAAWVHEIVGSGVTHLVVHLGVEKPDTLGAFLFALEKNPTVSPVGNFDCWPDTCRLYRLN
jgi:hypothetical protein